MKSHVEVLVAALVNVVAMLCITAALLADKCDSLTAVGSLLALAGLDVVSKLKGLKTPPAAPLAVLAFVCSQIDTGHSVMLALW